MRYPNLISAGLGGAGFFAVWWNGEWLWLPCSGGKIQPQVGINVPDTIHGSSGRESPTWMTRYSDGAVRYSGAVSLPFYLQTDFYELVTQWILPGATPVTILQSMDGIYASVCQSCYVNQTNISMNGTNEAVSINLTLEAKKITTATIIDNAVTIPDILLDDDHQEVCVSLDGTNYSQFYSRSQYVDGLPLQGWNTNCVFDGIYASSPKAVSWSVSIDNPTTVAHVLNASLEPVAVYQGQAKVAGKVVVFDRDGVPLPKQRNGSLNIELGTFGYIKVPNLYLDAFAAEGAEVNTPIVRNLSFNAFRGDYNTDVMNSKADAIQLIVGLDMV